LKIQQSTINNFDILLSHGEKGDVQLAKFDNGEKITVEKVNPK
jgi:hypothetical protein